MTQLNCPVANKSFFTKGLSFKSSQTSHFKPIAKNLVFTLLALIPFGKSAGASVIDSKSVLFLSGPQKAISSEITYEFQETPLAPGESISIDVPFEFQNKNLDQISISHRQKLGPNQPQNPGDQDSEPGLTAIFLKSTNESGDHAWKYWSGSASGDYGAKYAEVRPHGGPEIENLYEWENVGYRNIQDNRKDYSPLSVSKVKIVSIGSDTVWISRFQIKFRGTPLGSVSDEIFTPGTNFGDLNNGRGNRLGGGIQTNSFPSAIKLYPRIENRRPHNLPPHWKFENGVVIIPVPQGKVLSQAQIAIGDLHPELPPRAGLTYAPGGAMVSIGVSKNGGEPYWIVDHENVSPAGFVLATPDSKYMNAYDAFSVHIKVGQDTAYLMGLRLGFSN